MSSTTTTSDAARELHLFASNDAAVWRAVEHMARNYERKRAKGVYDSDLARKGMAHVTNAAAKAYVRQHCDTAAKWNVMFSPADRQAVAALLVDYLEGEWSVGNAWTA